MACTISHYPVNIGFVICCFLSSVFIASPVLALSRRLHWSVSGARGHFLIKPDASSTLIRHSSSPPPLPPPCWTRALHWAGRDEVPRPTNFFQERRFVEDTPPFTASSSFFLSPYLLRCLLGLFFDPALVSEPGIYDSRLSSTNCCLFLPLSSTSTFCLVFIFGSFLIHYQGYSFWSFIPQSRHILLSYLP